MRLRHLVLALTLLAIAGRSQAQSHWSTIPSPPGGQIWSLTADSTGHIYSAGLTQGICRLDSGTTSWKKVWAGVVYQFVSGPKGEIVAIGSNVRSSTDLGLTWSTILEFKTGGAGGFTSDGELVVALNTKGLLIRRNGVFELLGDDSLNSPTSVGFTLSGQCLVGTRDSGAYLLSSDQKHWTRSSLPKGQVTSIATTPAGSLIASLYGIGAYRSLDNSNTWTKVDTFLTKDVRRLVSKSPNNIFAATSDNGLLRSTDNGATWSRLGATQLDVSLSDVILAHGSVYVSSNTQGDGVSVSNDNGASWKPLSSGLIPQFKTLTVADDHAMYAGWDLGCMRSTNDGTTWQRQEFLPTAGDRPSFELAVDSVGNYFGYSVNGPALSTDKGASWQDASDSNLRKIGSLTDVEVSPNGTLFAISSDALSSPAMSTDHGKHWKKFVINVQRYEVPNKIMPYGDSLLLISAGMEGGLLITRDLGKTWRLDTVGMGLQSPGWFCKLPNGVILATTLQGVYRSSDTASSWKNTSALQFRKIVYVNSIAYGVSDSALYVSNDEGITWTLSTKGPLAGGQVYILPDLSVYAFDGYSTISKLGAGLAVPSRPSTSEALELYPNPASSIIHVRLDRSGPVSAEILDELGRRQDVISMAGSNGEYSFSVGSLPAGVYFVRCHQGTQTFEQRFVIMAH